MYALLVDSGETEVTVLEAALEDQGYQLATVESGGEAKSILSASDKDVRLLLVDWQTADAPRTVLLEWLKDQDLPSVETILLGENFRADDVRLGLDAGAYFFLNKPFDGTQLPAIVRAAVETAELRRNLARKVEESGETLRMLNRGRFHFRRPRQAELLAVQLGSASRDPQIGVAILELFLNAIEHGNLEIDYDEKGRLMERKELRSEIQKRLDTPAFRDRTVLVEVEQTDNGMDLVITDEGAGFDHERYQQLDKSRIFDSHGRGILMARAAVEVRYLGVGNQVRVKVPWAPEPAPAPSQ
jgi:DNA-binding response OmpR family regulator